MRKSSKKQQKKRHDIRVAQSPSVALVLVNQDKIRKEYIKKCKKTLKDLEKAKAEISIFENEDLPRYNQWYHNEFGSKLSEIREAHAKAGELYHKLAKIEYIANKNEITYYEAFLIVEDMEKNPNKYTEEDEGDHENSEYRDEDDWEDEDYGFYDEEEEEYEASEEEVEFAFNQFLKENPELAQAAKNPNFRKVLFQTFKNTFEEATRNKREEKEEPKAEKPLEERLKTRYRQLVRRLHPDFRKENSEHMDNLWHEVQKAYKERDLDRLDMLLAISAIDKGEFTDDFSLSQILDVQKEYKVQLQAIKSKLKWAKKERAWGFSKLKTKTDLTRSIKRELDTELLSEKKNLFHFQQILQEWSTPPRIRRRAEISRHYRTIPIF